jgi:hypothetical protein
MLSIRPDVVDAGDGLIRVTPTDDVLAERERQIIDREMLMAKARMSNMGVDGTVEQKGARPSKSKRQGLCGPCPIEYEAIGVSKFDLAGFWPDSASVAFP